MGKQGWICRYFDKLLEEQDGHTARRHWRVLASAVANGGHRLNRCRAARAEGGALGGPQRLSDADVGHASGHDRANDSEARPGMFRHCCRRRAAPSARASPSSGKRMCTVCRRGS